MNHVSQATFGLMIRRVQKQKKLLLNQPWNTFENNLLNIVKPMVLQLKPIF
jgi:hypothetical protein